MMAGAGRQAVSRAPHARAPTTSATIMHAMHIDYETGARVFGWEVRGGSPRSFSHIAFPSYPFSTPFGAVTRVTRVTPFCI